MTLGVDVGGTFTDFAYWNGQEIVVDKRPTTVDDQSIALAHGARDFVAGSSEPEALRHGTTVATNALLEGRGATIFLVTDPGFEDIIEIARQDRPSLYDSFQDRSIPLVSRALRSTVAVPESTEEVSDSEIDRIVEAAESAGATAIAVCLLDSYRDPTAEQKVRAALVAKTTIPVSISSDVVAEFREYERFSTTVLNAFLTPEVNKYLSGLSRRVTDIGIADEVTVMRSSGGLIPLEIAKRVPASILVSGPAGGVVAASGLGKHLGYDELISFDMGGTSTDVCRIHGEEPEIGYQRDIAGYACRMPAVAVHTVGAGGGSIGWIDDGGALRVGPQSAGADPGPASYGRGGSEPTVTDANLILGRLDSGTRLAGSVQLDAGLAADALERLGARIGLDAGSVAEGMLSISESHMSHAIRAVSVQQGIDPRTAGLVAFGGAGGLHASALGRSLEMASVVVPPYAGVFSALGLLMSPARADSAQTVHLSEAQRDMLGEAAQDESERAAELLKANTGLIATSVQIVADVRYAGQAHETPVPFDPEHSWDQLASDFHTVHEQKNGFALQLSPIEVVTIRGVATRPPELTWADLPLHVPSGERRVGERAIVVNGTEMQAEVLSRNALTVEEQIHGPALVEEGEATTFIGPGDTAVVHESGALVVTW